MLFSFDGFVGTELGGKKHLPDVGVAELRREGRYQKSPQCAGMFTILRSLCKKAAEATGNGKRLLVVRLDVSLSQKQNYVKKSTRFLWDVNRGSIKTATPWKIKTSNL